MKKKIIKITVILVVALVIAGISIWMISNQSVKYRHPIVMEGTIVTPSEIIDTGWIVIENGIIQEVSSQKPDILDAIELNINGIIYPGLVDVHNHVSFNVFPRWQPDQVFSNRYEWREDEDYVNKVSQPFDNLVSKHFCDMNTYGEVRAIIGGTTSILATAPNLCINGLARNLDFSSGFYNIFDKDKNHIKNIVNLPDNPSSIQSFLGRKSSEAFFIHLAEGIDGTSNAEFDQLINLGLLSAKTAIIHGTALESEQFRQMESIGAALVWSPRSNIELYGHTTDINSALDQGLLIALSPDWAVTGSANMLDELYYASEWNASHLDGRLTDKELVEMVTINPAIIAGIDEFVGTIQEGMKADLLILQGDVNQPYKTLVNADHRDVQLVMVDGVPIYGSPDYMDLFWEPSDYSIFEILGQSMAILEPDFSSIVETLISALLSEGVQLAPLVED